VTDEQPGGTVSEDPRDAFLRLSAEFKQHVQDEDIPAALRTLDEIDAVLDDHSSLQCR
jgi:hypothetical protein